MAYGHSSKDHAGNDENHTLTSKNDSTQFATDLEFDVLTPKSIYSTSNDINIISKDCLQEKLVIEQTINNQMVDFTDRNRPKLTLSCSLEAMQDIRTLKMILDSYDLDEFQLSVEAPECNFEEYAVCKFIFNPKDSITATFQFRVLAGEDAENNSDDNQLEETPQGTETNISNSTSTTGENNTNADSNNTDANTPNEIGGSSSGNETNTTSGPTNATQNTTETQPAGNNSNNTINSTTEHTNHTSTNSTQGHTNHTNTTSPSKGQNNETSTSPPNGQTNGTSAPPQQGNTTDNTSSIPTDSNKPPTTVESGSKGSSIDIDSSSNTLLITGVGFLVIVAVGLACYWKKKRSKSRKQNKGDRQKLVRKVNSPTPIKVPELGSPNTKSLKFAGPMLLSSEPNTGMSPLNQFMRPGPPHLRLEENGRSSLVPDEIILTNIDNSPKSVTEVSSLASVRDAPKTLDFNIEFSMVEQESIMKMKKGTEGKKKRDF